MVGVCLGRAPAGGWRALRSVLSLVITASVVSWSAMALGRSLDYRSQSYTGAPPIGEAITLEKWLATARSNGVTTLDGAIEALPANVRSNYVLMYRSRSLQRASFQRPRAIVFEGDGTFLAAFNGGEPGFKGGNVIETAQFRPDERRWEFREISFEDGRAPRVSDANPPKCLQCHQSPSRGQDKAQADPRPNWEPYFFWPGAYGSFDGDPERVLGSSWTMMRRLRPSDKPIVAEQAREAPELTAFLKDVKPHHLRYKWLAEFNKQRPVELTQLLHWPGFQRVARLTSATPYFDLYKGALAEMVRCSYEPADGNPAPRSLPSRLRRFHGAAYQELAKREASVRGENPANSSVIYNLSTRPTLTLRLHALFTPLGVDVADWSMDFKTNGRFAFYERMGGPAANALPFEAAVDKQLPEFDGLSCEEVRAKARNAWTNAGDRVVDQILEHAASVSAASLTDSVLPNVTLQRCVRCHAAEGSGPRLPFDDEAALAAQLKGGRYAKGSLIEEIEYRLSDLAAFDEQMPPTGMIRPSEREALVAYLKRLASQNETSNSRRAQ